MANSYDVVFIGAGHNALVCAAYLARAGKRVCVLERREVIGGACVSEEIWPGYKVSTASYVNSLLRPEIIKELELHRFGFAETSDVDEDRGEVAFRQRVAGRQREARSILALGILEPVKLLQCAAQVVAGVDVPRIDRQRLDEAVHCIRGAFQVAQDVAEIEPVQGVVGVPVH